MRSTEDDPFSSFRSSISGLESALRRTASDLHSHWSRSGDRSDDSYTCRVTSSGHRIPLPDVWNSLAASLLGRSHRRDAGQDDSPGSSLNAVCSCAHQAFSFDSAITSLTGFLRSASDLGRFKGFSLNGKDLPSLELFLRHAIEDMDCAGGANCRGGAPDRPRSRNGRSCVGFARVGGAPEGMAGAGCEDNSEEGSGALEGNGVKEELQKVTEGLLNIPSNVERLRSTISSFSLMELVEHFPNIGRSSNEHPDKKRLISVQDFFRYTEAEGRRFFEELDRDGDGQVTLEDVEVAIRKRNLPRRYAHDFFRRTRRHLFSKSFCWKQFLSLIKQKDPTILQAYTTLCLSKSGTLQKNQILATLENAGLPVNEENAIAMLRYLIADTNGSISYSHFRNFMLLLPSKRLKEDPRNIWFEAATVVAVPPPIEIPAESVLKSALAGGLASALSTSVLYPIDTMKTRVQASSLPLPELVSQIPQIGINGLYRGCIPAIVGQFSSHGLRTGIFEASKLVLTNIAPSVPDIQVQSIASFCSTILGTAVRIPCEVLKQRLQAGLFNNVGEAIVGTIRQDGIRGFFRGTGATLCREVPFYVAGMGLYAEAKKVAQNVLHRDLEPWETIAVGALSGGLAAVVTTPFDVMKTRMMTAQGRQVSMRVVAVLILRREGVLGLFKGALPRFFWIAPLGAMNFAGYELAKKAMERPDNVPDDVLSEKNISSSD